MIKFSIIAAVDSQFGISKDGYIPWHGETWAMNDMKWFRNCTMGGNVIMGRKTWDSIGSALKGRNNIVITRRDDLVIEGGTVACSFDEALACVDVSKRCFVIGGGEIFKQALDHPLLELAYISVSDRWYNCDTFFPKAIAKCEYNVINKKTFELRIYNFSNNAEKDFLELLEELLEAPLRSNRTAVPTRGVFYRALRFPLYDHRGAVMPIPTTKRVPFKSVAHELIWFIRGDTDISYLEEHNVKIWRANTSRQVLDMLGKADWPEGTLGRGYGFQWRRFGADGDKAGVDQLRGVVEGIKRDPYSRRHVVTAWNPQDLNDVALPPCHVMFQFHVDSGRLNCCMTQRSGDAFLALGSWNTVEYALLTHIVALLCGLKPGELVISCVDVHLYNNHCDAARLQVSRIPNRYPTFRFSDKIHEAAKSGDLCIDDFAQKFTVDDFILEHYKPYPPINALMTV